MNLNTLAKEVSTKEGGVENLSIAQIKEVVRHTLDLLAQEDPVDVLVLLRKRLFDLLD